MNLLALLFTLVIAGLILLKIAGVVLMSWWAVVGICVGLVVLWVVILFAIFWAALSAMSV